MHPKNDAEFVAAMAEAFYLASISRKKKSTWMVEYKGIQHFVTVEKIK